MQKEKSELQAYFDELAEKWPSSFVARDQVETFTGGIISSGRMANLDCLGEGPPSFRSGRKRVYPVKPYLEWLLARSEPIAEKV